MFCHTCDKEIEHDADECPSCGGPLSETPPEPSEKPRFDNVITIISDEDDTNTESDAPGSQTDEPPADVGIISQPTAFVSFGQLEPSDGDYEVSPKRKFPLKLILIPALTVAVMIVAVVLAMDFFKPELAKSLNALYSDMGTRVDSSIFSVMEPLSKCLENGEVNADISYTDEYGDTISGSVALGSSSETDIRRLSLKAQIYGSPVDAILLVGENYAALGSSLLGKSYYGVRFDSFDEDFTKFAKSSGLTGLSPDFFSEFINMLDYASNGNKAFTPSVGATIELNRMLTEFSRDLTSTESREKMTIGGKSVRATVLTYSLSVAEIINLGHNFIDFARTDESIRALLIAYLNYYGSYDFYDNSIPRNGMLLPPRHAPEGETREPIENFLDELEYSLDYLTENYSGDLHIRLVFAKGHFYALELNSALIVEGSPLDIRLTFNFGHRVYDNWELDCYVKSETESFRFNAVWAFSIMDNVPVNELTLTVDDGYSREVFTVRSRWEQSSGDFSLSLRDSTDRVNVNLRGNLKCSTDSFDLALDTTPELTLQISGRTNCSIAQPDFINLDLWTQDTLMLFVSAVDEFVNGIYSYTPTLVPYEPALDTEIVIS